MLSCLMDCIRCFLGSEKLKVYKHLEHLEIFAETEGKKMFMYEKKRDKICIKLITAPQSR